MTEREKLLHKAQLLPEEAGCYLMKDHEGQVIYVGKAKRLKQRVTSYFNQSIKSIKTEFMVNQVVDFEFFITKSEVESYVLENNLIKKFVPKYNIRLRDDKRYPYIELNPQEPFPRLEFTRKITKDKKNKIFGPFPTGSGLTEALRSMTKAFRLRDCSDHEFKSRKTPCLLFQMHQCSAPCVGEISKEKYQESLDYSLMILQGGRKAQKAIEKLYQEMETASDEEAFEKASMIHSQIKNLEYFLNQQESQSVESLKEEKNSDIWGLFIGEKELDLSLYQVRKGNLLGQKTFHFLLEDLWQSQKDDLITFFLQYYAQTLEPLPDHLIFDFFADVEELKEALKKVTQHEMKIWYQKKKYHSLIEMAQRHAEESQRMRIAEKESLFFGLKKLKELLNLKELPRKIECYDIAIWQGQSPTASQVVSTDGKLDKKLYRYFHLQVRPEGNNDFAMMKEVVERRIQHGDLPDVFLIDGGIAQVNTVVKVLEEFKVDLPVLGIAKAKDINRGNFKKETKMSNERLIIPGRMNPYLLDKDPALMKIILPLRDEAHRFSRKLHHHAEKNRIIKSWVEDLKGLNAHDKKSLLAKIDLPFNELKMLTVDELKVRFNFNAKELKSLIQYLFPKTDPN
jgi:excinuclease ABC subunit C